MTLLGAPGVETRVAASVATAVPCDRVDPIAVFEAARAAGLDASLWLDQATERALVGVDVAARLVSVGPGRFERLAEVWRALIDTITLDGPAADSPLAGPLLLGGAAFRDQPSADPRWQGFDAVAFEVLEAGNE